MRRWLPRLKIGLGVIMVVIAALLAGCRCRDVPNLTLLEAADDSLAVVPDTTAPGEQSVHVAIPEAVFNDLLGEIVPLRNSGHLLFKSKATRYTWTVRKPSIRILPGKAEVHATLDVEMLSGTYSTAAQAEAKVHYEAETQELYLSITDAKVDLHAAGNAIRFPRVKLGSIFPDRIKLLGALPLAKSFKVKNPDKTEKYVEFQIPEHTIRYETGQLILELVMKFAPGEKPTDKKRPAS